MERATTSLTRKPTGRDELNLAEFPIGLLSDRQGKEPVTSLVFQDGEKEWVVEGSPQFGLPTPSDVQVYVVLMELTREQGFPERIYFTRHEVLQRLNWTGSGRSYDRFELALDRLHSVSIRTKNAFFAADKKEWEKKTAFHILDGYELYSPKQPSSDLGAPFTSWIQWSPILYLNMREGYIKALDVDLFLSLRSSIAQALYRYLDAKKFDGKPMYRIGIKKLAWAHLGLARTYAPAHLKRELDRAHQELLECGFLSDVAYAPMKTSRREEMVIYYFHHPKALSRPEPECQDESDLAPRLIAAGISRKDALAWAENCPEECERQLAWLPQRGALNPAAVLAKSIREGWGAPAAPKKSNTVVRKTPDAGVVPATELAEFERWWDDLVPAEQERRRTEALETWLVTNQTLRPHAAKFPGSPMIIEGVKEELLKHWSKLTGKP